MKLIVHVADRITNKGEIKPHVMAFLSTREEQIVPEKDLPDKAARLVELSTAMSEFVERFYMKFNRSSSDSSVSRNTEEEPSTS